MVKLGPKIKRESVPVEIENDGAKEKVGMLYLSDTGQWFPNYELRQRLMMDYFFVDDLTDAKAKIEDAVNRLFDMAWPDN